MPGGMPMANMHNNAPNSQPASRQNGRIALYALLVMAFLAIISETPLLALLAILITVAIGTYFVLDRLLPNPRTAASPRRDAVGKIIEYMEDFGQASPAQRARDEAQEVADRAMTRAGHVVSEASIHLDDIGLLVYDDLKTPKIYRTTDIPTDAAYVRPFIVLSQPEMPGASGYGVLRFSLIDGKRKLRFTSRAKYRLHPGQNFVTPPTWLPLAGEQLEQTWMLHIMLSDTPLAIINFDWLQVGGTMRARFNGDGEIDAQTLQQLGGAAQVPLSLDELLADQGEVEIEGISISASHTANSRR
jgi:hypothetical protein